MFRIMWKTRGEGGKRSKEQLCFLLLRASHLSSAESKGTILFVKPTEGMRERNKTKIIRNDLTFLSLFSRIIARKKEGKKETESNILNY